MSAFFWREREGGKGREKRKKRGGEVLWNSMLVREFVKRSNYLHLNTNLLKKMVSLCCLIAWFVCVDVIMQMEVGIEDCLHIEFEYGKSK